MHFANKVIVLYIGNMYTEIATKSEYVLHNYINLLLKFMTIAFASVDIEISTFASEFASADA